MQPSLSTPGPGRSADTCPAPPRLDSPPAARARAAASSLGPASASGRAPRDPDMSAQEPPQGRRFPIEAGDSPGLAASRESQDSLEQVATEHNPVRKTYWDVLGGTVVKNLPANAGDTGSSRGLGRSHMPRSN
nr:protein FAM229A isoform X1 [Kogia breviceps]